MRPVNLGDQLQAMNLQSNASITTTGNGSTIDLQELDGEILVTLKVSAPVAGSSPTLACVLQESSDDSSYTDVTGGSFTGVTSAASNQSISLNKNELKRYVQLKRTIGGTSSPQYYVAATVLGIKKYCA